MNEMKNVCCLICFSCIQQQIMKIICFVHLETKKWTLGARELIYVKVMVVVWHKKSIGYHSTRDTMIGKV